MLPWQMNKILVIEIEPPEWRPYAPFLLDLRCLLKGTFPPISGRFCRNTANRSKMEQSKVVKVKQGELLLTVVMT